MEPLTAASAFSTIVGLIGQFRSERSGQGQTDFNEFLAWLVDSRHDDLKNLLETNAQATAGVKAILQRDMEAVRAELETINSALSHYASTITGFAELAEAVNPDALLSDQALSVLRQLEESGGSKVLELHTMDSLELLVLDSESGSIDFSEPRFIEDDLETLTELRLLRNDINRNGDNVYTLTRAGARLVQSQRSCE